MLGKKEQKFGEHFCSFSRGTDEEFCFLWTLFYAKVSYGQKLIFGLGSPLI